MTVRCGTRVARPTRTNAGLPSRASGKEKASSGAPPGYHPALATVDVRALGGVACRGRPCPSIGDAGHSLDPKVAVAQPKVPGQRGRGAIHVDAVIPGPDGDIGLKQTAGSGRLHQIDPVDVAVCAPGCAARYRDRGALKRGNPDPGVACPGDEVWAIRLPVPPSKEMPTPQPTSPSSGQPGASVMWFRVTTLLLPMTIMPSAFRSARLRLAWFSSPTMLSPTSGLSEKVLWLMRLSLASSTARPCSRCLIAGSARPIVPRGEQDHPDQ